MGMHVLMQMFSPDDPSLVWCNCAAGEYDGMMDDEDVPAAGGPSEDAAVGQPAPGQQQQQGWAQPSTAAGGGNGGADGMEEGEDVGNAGGGKGRQEVQQQQQQQRGTTEDRYQPESEEQQGRGNMRSSVAAKQRAVAGEEDGEIQEGEARCGTCGSRLSWRLTGGVGQACSCCTKCGQTAGFLTVRPLHLSGLCVSARLSICRAASMHCCTLK